MQAAIASEFATGWLYQLKQLFTRLAISYWRTPTYVMSKFMLSILGGLLIGFTFFHSKDTLQGTQNKLFVRFYLQFQTSHLLTPYSGYLHVYYLVCAIIEPAASRLH